ncbi:dephospho-CoA kinase [Helicobacter saguini]|uniref:Dephospho-CoA kinase n=1 Tax=Helicobacter saguini TaxID=1548018 RepID=A0A347VNB1_9HELI|nr:dephospho-CoA kinase [Helicobacter saguini]MWV61834.1 dephospho-CoA kinase [Helicobacter saguini]MWV67491.1 dephospho-CoA kinase [Helicobacter saguini]MWV69842.1 dephospho-CoA kinase [Helicobacter saguini]MWV72940.1 dephospho-CoA kinase [Helicobacter saguini]TLD95676.1 dephospho-CoA kinase [Helicobacter saguini]
MMGNILTGGIACGKSTVANLLKLEGFGVIDADSISHKILDENSLLIASHFGDSILQDSKINRAALGKIIFNDSNQKELLESILHPLIYERISKECSILESKNKPYFIDIPLYFESKYNYKARFVVCVYASKEIQLQRLMIRNNLSKDEALKRVESQIDIELKRQKSDFVIENVSDLKTLQKNVESFLKEFYKAYQLNFK